MSAPMLEIDRLSVGFPDTQRVLVDELSLAIEAGSATALVGESGSGKTLSMLAVMGLLPPGIGVLGGEARLEGVDLLALPPRARRRLNGSRIALIPQDAMAALNPTLDVQTQFELVLRTHERLGGAAAKARTVELLDQVGIPSAASRLRSYPHEFSGGQRQRVMIALALSCRPELLIADEPTTALDVTIQQQILDLVARLREELDMTVLWITHDLGVVAGLADRVAVLRHGRMVESGTAEQIFFRPEQPYTRQLLAATPTLFDAEPGTEAQP
ncbi:ABC transporter ATP-binding protein [Leucobacter allii]|uniref:ABC transporter ATP-binding protein n=1 Tax=Leucobacter allii TaxID=2932247 RepID=UPI001FD31B63|nr:ABC transporter ATP-binding protein [Leucobacter allii]UOR01458.1 ABC transporter ATP-binding protein [Leucobacter allii]